jgi:Ca-activated chloride channel family protein
MTHSSAALLTSTVLACVAGDVASLGAQRSQRPSESRTRQVYVSVVDNAGKPVTGLTAADFRVREDGNVREVLGAGPATDPITIGIGVDDSQSAQSYIQFIRDGLNGFVKRLDGKAQIALTTFGERPTVLVDYTDSTVALQKGITRIFSRQGGGAYLLEALVELSQGMQRRENAPRKAIVILTVEAGPEFSNLYSRNVVDALKRGGATLHVLALGTPSASTSDEMRNRNMSIADGTALTGGRRDQVLAESGIGDRLLQLADEMTNQYVVTYSRPESLIPPEKLDVGVGKPGLTVRAPKQAPGK